MSRALERGGRGETDVCAYGERDKGGILVLRITEPHHSCGRVAGEPTYLPSELGKELRLLHSLGSSGMVLELGSFCAPRGAGMRPEG